MANILLNSVFWNHYTLSIERIEFDYGIRDCWAIVIAPDEDEDDEEYYIEYNLIHAVEMYLTVLDEFIW